ncbi:splicing factor PF30 [Ceratocystis lukuohia]|uniref:Splicing factor PF30 n=1 Tax=Ceratocystis lukuohia TaxID=2019550 RepID=A0ABR4MTY3_9PEZI
MSNQSELEQDRLLYQEQLNLVESQLKEDSDNGELKGLREELTQIISFLNESLAELKPKEPQPATTQTISTSASTGLKKTVSTTQPIAAVPAANHTDDETTTYRVNDIVLARWVSGDRGFYPARITSITGSITAPVYTVKFKSYDTSETLRARDIKPFSNKRKADDTLISDSAPVSMTSGSSTPAVESPSTFSPIPNAPGASAATGTVVSAAASLYPDQVARMRAEKGTLDGEDKPRKAKKMKANKELEAGKSKWQDFQTKSKFGKTQKKDSMFRTPEGVNGRVGFTGSGKAMRKDSARTRHVYQPADDMD